MICLCEAHFKTEELLATFVCAVVVFLHVLGSCWFLHPGRFPVGQGVVHTAQLHTGYDRLPVLHMVMTIQCQTGRCQLS